MLTTTNSHTSEGASPGSGRGGVGGSGGAPARYAFTVRGWVALSPWNEAPFAYSIMQLYMGSNFIGNLEVVSLLNIPSQAREMYYYSPANRTAKYNPKVYLGTLQSIAYWWITQYQNGAIWSINNWPNSYQSNSQKGEANTEGK